MQPTLVKMKKTCTIGAMLAGLIIGSDNSHADSPAPVRSKDGWQTTVISASTADSAARGQRKAKMAPVRQHALKGLASYYGHGTKTASGEPFDKMAMTAAHPTLPFQSIVKVTDRASGNSVVVRINDRGPFVPGRVIDLSEGAAEVIGMKRRGITPVEIEVLKTP